jgi:hypothetical protein
VRGRGPQNPEDQANRLPMGGRVSTGPSLSVRHVAKSAARGNNET